jgi:hypothetical protein
MECDSNSSLIIFQLETSSDICSGKRTSCNCLIVKIGILLLILCDRPSGYSNPPDHNIKLHTPQLIPAISIQHMLWPAVRVLKPPRSQHQTACSRYASATIEYQPYKITTTSAQQYQYADTKTNTPLIEQWEAVRDPPTNHCFTNLKSYYHPAQHQPFKSGMVSVLLQVFLSI